MSWTIDVAAAADFLEVAALDRIAWPQAPDTFIPDGEHIWRVWAEYATLLVARLAPDERGVSVATDSRLASAAARDAAPSQIVGALVMFPTRQGENFLHKIMVHPDHRGAGLGTALMREALRRADGTVLLTVDPANAAAVRLYENFGFQVRERVDGYYRPHEHRLVMEYRP